MIPLSLLTIFAGPICLGPETEKGDSLLLGFILTALFVAGWIILGIASLIFHLRKTLSTRRKNTLKIILSLQFLAYFFVAIGSFFGGEESTTGYCKVAVSTFSGELSQKLALLILVATVIAGFIFILLFERKTKKLVQIDKD